MDSGVAQQMLAALKPAGLAGVSLLAGPFARPFGLRRPLLAASDYRGARMGTFPAQVDEETFRTLGARPDTGDQIAAMTGIETDVESAAKVFDVPGATLTGNVIFWPWPGVLFMNQRAFGSLTAGQKDLLSRAAAQSRAGAIWLGNDTTNARDLCRRGNKIITASAAELAGLRAAVQPVYRSLAAGPLARGVIEQITSMRQAMGDAPDSLTCPPGHRRIQFAPGDVAGHLHQLRTRGGRGGSARDLPVARGLGPSFPEARQRALAAAADQW
jgi:TRAP-type C4-dicarboxylate transport system substrate-binding protein